MTPRLSSPLWVFLAAIFLSSIVSHANDHLDQRWFFCFGYERNRADVEKIKSLFDVGAENGLNGMVLSWHGLDGIGQWSARDIEMLREVAAHCAAKGIELIPTGLSAGYGGSALGYDQNFAAALPVEITLMAEGGRIVPSPGSNLLANGDLESHHGDCFDGFDFHDKPGRVSFGDLVAPAPEQP